MLLSDKFETISLCCSDYAKDCSTMVPLLHHDLFSRLPSCKFNSCCLDQSVFRVGVSGRPKSQLVAASYYFFNDLKKIDVDHMLTERVITISLITPFSSLSSHISIIVCSVSHIISLRVSFACVEHL